ncbi:apolipoprotein L2-like [Equus asinus]|uniref:Apolipoprotein L3-like n=2 Tax=Equus asinus TaxID=9793 RepID=A0A9L0JIW3_EQUAS|nr:apolipoprotein L2-like isoform X1 [Equus asinus]XP_044636391.1 apolipoprotein L2-like isoform X1 [Equus asinus]
MSSEARGVSPESESSVEDITECFQNRVSREGLQRLQLTDEEAWKRLVAGAGLSRDEADTLHKCLKNLNIDQLNREKFLNEFPQVKQEIEKRIRQLPALADKINKIHRDCTISNVVAKSAGTVSGILSILGLALAPVTAGASLALSATGIGLGAAAGVVSMSSSIVDYSSKLSAKFKASQQVSTDINKGEIVKETLDHITPHVASSRKNFTQVLKIIREDIGAMKVTKGKPQVAASANCFMTITRISAQSCRLMRKVLGRTTLAMTKGVRIVGGATAGVFLLWDVASLVMESKHLHEGAKAESAEELRQQAEDLERILENLTQIHEMLQGLAL